MLRHRGTVQRDHARGRVLPGDDRLAPLRTQQSALALGVATLGSLFLSLSSTHSIGVRAAFVVVLAVQVAVAVLVAAGSRLLPAPEARAEPVVAPEEPLLEAA